MANRIFTEVELLAMASSERSKYFTPCTTIVYVKASDVDNINFFTGTIGQPKIITEYSNPAGTIVNCITSFFYTDSENPQQPTKILVC